MTSEEDLLEMYIGEARAQFPTAPRWQLENRFHTAFDKPAEIWRDTDVALFKMVRAYEHVRDNGVAPPTPEEHNEPPRTANITQAQRRARVMLALEGR